MKLEIWIAKFSFHIISLEAKNTFLWHFFPSFGSFAGCSVGLFLARFAILCDHLNSYLHLINYLNSWPRQKVNLLVHFSRNVKRDLMKGWLYIKFSAVEKCKEDTSLKLKWYFAEKHWELNEKQLFLCCHKSNRDELKLHDFCNFLYCPHRGWMSSCRGVLMVQLIITISAFRCATLRNILSWTWKRASGNTRKALYSSISECFHWNAFNFCFQNVVEVVFIKVFFSLSISSVATFAFLMPKQSAIGERIMTFYITRET